MSIESYINSVALQLRTLETQKCYVRRILEHMKELAVHPGFHQFAWENWIKRVEKRKFGPNLIEKLNGGEIIDDFCLSLDVIDEELLALCGVSKADIELCILWKDDLLINGTLSSFLNYPDEILQSFDELIMEVPQCPTELMQLKPALANRFIELEESCAYLTKLKHDHCLHTVRKICEDRDLPPEVIDIIHEMINFECAAAEPIYQGARICELPHDFCELIGVELLYSSFKPEDSDNTEDHAVSIEMHWREFHMSQRFICLPGKRYYIPLGWRKMEAFKNGKHDVSNLFLQEKWGHHMNEKYSSRKVSVHAPYEAVLEDAIIYYM